MLPTYSTGTVAVTAGGTTVTGSGTIWSGINAKQGDFISINNLSAVLVTEVTDATHLKIPPWQGSTVSAVPYVIYQNYVGRVVGVAAAEDVADMLERLRGLGPIFAVPLGETAPDPSYGTDGQYAYQQETATWWLKTSGVWTITSSPVKGYGGTSTSSVTIGTGSKVFTTQPGLAYIAGGRVRAVVSTDATKWLEGTIASYNSGSGALTITADATLGSGTFASWNFQIAGMPGTGTGDVVGPASAVADRIATFNGTTGKLIKDGGKTIAEVLAGTGDVVGPAGAVADRIATFNGTTGKLVKDGGKAIAELVPLTGATLTGILQLSQDPTAALHAATKQYADSAFRLGKIPTTATVTITNASPAVITWTGHNLAVNAPVFFSTTGALPTGLSAAAVSGAGTFSANTYTANPPLYYVRNVLGANTYTVSATIGGAEINTSSAGSGTHTAFANAMTPTGYIGEYIYNVVTIPSAFSLTTGSAGQVWNTISLTAGVWLVGANTGVIKLTSTPVFTHMHCGIVYGFSTIPTTPFNGAIAAHITSNQENGWMFTNNPEKIFLTTTTTMNAVVTADFSGGTAGAYGKLWAIRIA